MPRWSRDRRLQRLLDRARALGAEGHGEEAEALLRAALKRHPHNAELRLTLAIEVFASAPAESRRQLEQAAELAHDDPPTLFRVASALRDVDEQQAARAVERLLELTDENFIFFPELMHLRGLLARDAGDDERAEPLLREAFDQAPETRNHGRWLAGLLIDHERYSEALDTVQAALEHRPGDEDLIEMRDWLEAELD